MPSRPRRGRLPGAGEADRGKPSPDRHRRRDRGAQADAGLPSRSRAGYDDARRPGGKGTSHLSADIRWGCVIPRSSSRGRRARRRGGGPFVRQLCWRDFHHQVLAAFPSLPRRDYRARGDRWSRSEKAFEAWLEGPHRLSRWSMPAMRQLAAEGYMHNRARMTVGSFLDQGPLRRLAQRGLALLGPARRRRIANNAGNWQWIAGTGNDTRPNRVMSPVRQAERFDPDGIYVRRWVPELAGVRGKAIFRPWLMEGFEDLDYPEPIVDHDDAVAEFRARRD